MKTGLELLRLKLTDFRAFAGSHEFTLGRITILSGANGLGKTTFFDAIDWALFGERSRLGSSPGTFPNLWEPRQPRVELETTHGVLKRDEAGASLGDSSFRPTQLLLDPAVFVRGTEAEVALPRLVYLPQQDIRDLVEGDDSARSFLVAALSGVPNAERFARNLDRTLSDISARQRATTEQTEKLLQRRAELEQHLDEQRQALIQAQAVGAVGPGFLAPDMSSLTSTTLLLGQRVTETRDRQLHMQERLRRFEVGRRDLRGALDRWTLLNELLSGARRRLSDLATKSLRVDELHADVTSNHERALSARDVAMTQLAVLQEEDRLLQVELDDVLARNTLERQRDALAVRGQSLKQEADQLRSQVAASVAVENDARQRAASARSQFEALRKERDARSMLSQVFQTTEAELTRSLEQLARETSRIEKEDASLQDVEKDLAVARAEAGRSSRQGERLASLVQELTALRDPDDSRCPACHHDHSTSDALHVRMSEVLSELHGRSELLHRIQELDVKQRAAAEAVAASRRSMETLGSRIRDLRRTADDARNALSSAAAQAVGRDPVVTAEELESMGADVDRAKHARLQLEKALSDADLRLESCRSEWRSVNHALQGGVPQSSPSREGELRTRQESIQQSLSLAKSNIERTRSETDSSAVRLAEARRARTQMVEEVARLEAETRTVEAEFEVVSQTLGSLRDGARREGADGEPEDVLKRLAELQAVGASRLTEINADLERDERAYEKLQLVMKLSSLPNSEAEMSAVHRELAAVQAQRSTMLRAQRRLEEIGQSVRRALDAESIAARNRCQLIIDAIMRVLSPHRHLNTVRIESGGGIRLVDESLPKPVNAVEYSSAGQMNLIGLAVFLGVGLGTRGSILQTLMLDEPVQNLDDVNVLNFVDLVRGLARSHQVVLSTADSNFADLLRAKLGPWAVAEKHSVVVHEFRDFDRQTGPIVRTHNARQIGELPGFD